MKIFVVGGAGYIGSVCSELLLDEGHDVVIFDNLSEGHRAAVDSRTHFIEGELGDRQQIQAALSNHRPDAVMHFAANALVGESMQNPSKYFRNNICNGLNLLDAMVAADVRRIVFSSTCAIFGPPDRVPIDETAQPRPVSPYGESKLAFENRTWKSTAPTTTRRMEPVFAITFTSSISLMHISWRSAKAPAAVTISALVAVQAFKK